MSYTGADGVRIWRLPGVTLYGDEAQGAAGFHDDDFRRVVDAGFNAIWMHERLYRVMNSAVLPWLNAPDHASRIDAFARVIDRASRHGVGLYLYFNDPQAVPGSHPLWRDHPDLKGQAFPFGNEPHFSLCMSMPQSRHFIADAARSVLDRLPGLGGVILITACEHPTHCWSKANIRMGRPPTNCPRCAAREPADSVLPVLQAWADAATSQPMPPRVLAWNWEWAYWYDDPPSPIVDRLPEGVELLLDNEIGGALTQHGKTRAVREYSLAYTGPSDRFISIARFVRSAGKKTPIHAKVEFNATHELCTVPNVPVLATIHARLASMAERDIAGFLGCWSMSCAFTLNTAALRVFLMNPARHRDADAFFSSLARSYFGTDDAAPLASAWRKFSLAWRHYPHSLAMLYRGPHNDAPARAMTLDFAGKPLGRSWQVDPPGDDLSSCLRNGELDPDAYSLDEVIAAFAQMADEWEGATPSYVAAIKHAQEPATLEVALHRTQETSVARAIGLQLRSTSHAFEFHRARADVMARLGLAAPCRVPMSDDLVEIMSRELAVLRQMLPLVEADARLGYHFDCGQHKYDSQSIRGKIDSLLRDLDWPRVSG